jgi:hypothetical protein
MHAARLPALGGARCVDVSNARGVRTRNLATHSACDDCRVNVFENQISSEQGLAPQMHIVDRTSWGLAPTAAPGNELFRVRCAPQRQSVYR